MRNRYFDLLRAAAIARVVLYHTLGYAWLTVIFPAMGLMFALGGSLMAASLDRSGGGLGTISRRLRRVLLPMWLLSAVAVSGMLLTGMEIGPDLLLWAFPLVHPPTNDWGAQWLGMIWYIREYLWFVVLSPALLWAFRRRPVLAIAAPFALLLLLTFADLRVDPVISDFALYAPAWLLGFAQYDGMLAALSRWVLWSTAGVLAVCGLGWLYTHPGPRGFDLNDVPLANALWSSAVLIVLLGAVRISVPRSDVIDALNRRAITVYLWHEAVIAFVGAVAVAAGVSLLGSSGAMIELASVVGLIVVVVAALGWVEDVAARRPLRLWPVGRQRHVPEPAPEPAR